MIKNKFKLLCLILYVSVCGISCMSPITKQSIHIDQQKMNLPYYLDLDVRFDNYQIFMVHQQNELTTQALEECFGLLMGPRVEHPDSAVLRIKVDYDFVEHRLTWIWYGNLRLTVMDKAQHTILYSRESSGKYIFTNSTPQITDKAKYTIVYNTLADCVRDILPSLGRRLARNIAAIKKQSDSDIPEYIYQKPNLAILDFGTDILGNSKDQVLDNMYTVFEQSIYFNVLEKETLDNELERNSIELNTEPDINQLIQIGNMLGVRKLIVPLFKKQNSFILADLVMIDIWDKKIETRQEFHFVKNPEDLLLGVNNLITYLARQYDDRIKYAYSENNKQNTDQDSERLHKVKTESNLFVDYDIPAKPLGGFHSIQKHLNIPGTILTNLEEGHLLVNVLVDSSGDIVQTRVLNSSNRHHFEKEIIKAIKSVKWQPAIKKGHPIKAWIDVPIFFEKSN